MIEYTLLLVKSYLLFILLLTMHVDPNILYRNDISKENSMLKYIVLGTLYTNALTGQDIWQ